MFVLENLKMTEKKLQANGTTDVRKRFPPPDLLRKPRPHVSRLKTPDVSNAWIKIHRRLQEQSYKAPRTHHIRYDYIFYT